jgi:hypothetical protein
MRVGDLGLLYHNKAPECRNTNWKCGEDRLSEEHTSKLELKDVREASYH